MVLELPGRARGKGSWSGALFPWDGQHGPAGTGAHRGGKRLAQPFHTPPAQKHPAGQLMCRGCCDIGYAQQRLKRTDISFYQKIRAGGGKSHLELARRSRRSSSSHSQLPKGRRNCTGVIIPSAFVQVGIKMHFPGPVKL